MKWAHVSPIIVTEHRLLARAALAPRADAEAAWAAWRQMVNFDDIDGPSQRLLPLIVRRDDVIPDDDAVRGRVRGMYRQAWVSNQRLWRDAGEVLDRLADAHVPVMVLKGASLLSFYDNDWGVRPMFDIDIAVPTGAVVPAFAALRAAGWRAEQRQSDAWLDVRMRRQRHSWGHERGEQQHLDLHWRITSDVMWDGANAGWWDGARSLTVGGREILAMHPADILIHVLIHGTRGGNCPPVQWVVDAAVVARQMVEDAESLDRWTQRSRSLDLVLALRAALDVAIDVVPDPALTEVRARLPRSVSVIDRMRMAPAPLSEVAAQIARDAAGGAGLARGVLGTLRRLTEVDLVNHPRVAMVEASIGRPLWLSRIRRRVLGTLVKPPAAPRPGVLPIHLDLTDPSVLDHHGGAGWRLVLPDGTRTVGRWSALLVVVGDGQVPVGLSIELRAMYADVDVELIVDGRVVQRSVATTDGTVIDAPLDRSLDDRRPMEIVLRGCRRRGVGRRAATSVAVIAVVVR